ncbi:MAG: FISUMP domain-containing protein [Patescibacteria group bacterium]
MVVTILAILATIGFLALSGYSQDAKDSAIKANVRSVVTAISSESAITNNSPRYYVVHDAAAALTGSAVAYVDGNPVVLTGGDWNAAGTNYSAGNPNWALLKLNPEKFKLSSLPNWFQDTFAAYDPKAVSVGALDAALAPTASGRNRSASFFQAAGVAPSGGVSVAGTFPQPTAAQIALGAVAGLVKNPSSSSNTGALVDGGASAVPTGNQTPAGPTTYPGCDTQDIYFTGANQYWAACNVGAYTKFSGYVASGNDSPAATASSAGMFFQWGENVAWDFSSGLTANNNCTWDRNSQSCGGMGPVSSWPSSVSDTTNGGSDRWYDWSANDKQGPCAPGYHVPTRTEWNAAITAAGSNRNTLVSTLKLPMAGYRKDIGTFTSNGNVGQYWTSSPGSESTVGSYVNIGTSTILAGDNLRISGFSVRCIRN